MSDDIPVPQEGRPSAEQAEALKTVALGMDAERFLGTNVGRYLIERAEQQRMTALDALAHHSPVDADGIRALQAQVAVVDSIQQWLADAITEGRAIEQQLYEQTT